MEGLISLSGLHFFGLTQEYRATLFTQLHDIVFHGKGGYTFDTVYEFPIWLRRFVYRSMIEFYEKERKASEQPTPSNSQLQNGKIKVPDYSTKARN